MGIAAQFNRAFTAHLVTQPPPGKLGPNMFMTTLKGGVTHAFQGSPKARPYIKSEQAPPLDPLAACSLEHQAGMFRAFRRFDGELLHSHSFRLEAIRRTERDGYHFTHAIEGV